MNAPTQQIQISPEELKPVPCETCGAFRRKLVTWAEDLVHRFRPELSFTNQKSARFCLQCDTQLDLAGKRVKLTDPDWLPKHQKEKLWR